MPSKCDNCICKSIHSVYSCEIINILLDMCNENNDIKLVKLNKILSDIYYTKSIYEKQKKDLF